MNKDELLRAIHENGYCKEYYHFYLELPVAILGTTNEGLIKKWFPLQNMETPDINTGWFDKKCHIPINIIDGVEIVAFDNMKIILNFIVSTMNIGRFVEKLWKELKMFSYDVSVVDIKKEEK